MRIIKEKTLKDKCSLPQYKHAETHLVAWVREIENVFFDNPNQLKNMYGNASILSNKRVVFNIKGNDFRLITDIEYKLGIVFIFWFGSHEEYDKINAKTVKYEN